MKHKEGRIGVQEGICAAAIALCVNGIFTIDPKYAYVHGNSTYLSIPLAALLSLCVFLFVAGAMQRRKCVNLPEFFRDTAGAFGSKVATVPVLLSLMLCAAAPASRFVQVMHGLIYSGVEYHTIIFFIFPAIVILAWTGFECIGRVSKFFSFILLFALVIVIVSASSSFEVYRLYPLLGDGIVHFTTFTASETLSFLPPLVALLIMGKGMQGVVNARKAGIYAGIIAAIICGVVQLSLSLVFTYKGLSETFMPLYRINFFNIVDTYLLRLDKLLIMAWLNGCILSCAFCIYAASLMFARTFEQRDINASILTISAVVIGLVFAEFRGAVRDDIATHNIIVKYGSAFVAAPLIILGAIAFIRKKKELREI